MDGRNSKPVSTGERTISMKTQFFKLLGIASVGLLLSSCATHHQPVVVTPQGEVVVSSTPPVAKHEVPGTPSTAYEQWVPGYWTYRDARWVWIPGRWANPPSTGSHWVPGHWDYTNRGWVWTPGHWATIG